MIRSFRSKGLALFAQTGNAKKLSVEHVGRVARVLNQLNAATKPDDLNLPGNRFHALTGDRAGTYAVNASGNYRITFRWDGQDAVDVDLEDYH